MPNVAVILSGCGYLDGAEIREAVLALTALDKEGATVEVFAPNIPQRKVVNHLTGEDTDETRNVLVESARIARGKVRDLDEAKAEAFDALVLPGGFGAALNLSDIALKGAEGTVIPALKNLILDFLKAGKPIGAICISPAVLVASVKKNVKHS
jgi:enhancing lycopene biosynthesis protein 2